MEGKVLSFPIRGMQRDLSRSKFNPEYSYENKNIRIVSQGDGTLFSVVNERGQKRINLKTKEPKTYNIKIHGNVSEVIQTLPQKYNITIYGMVSEVVETIPVYTISISGNITEIIPDPPGEYSISIYGNISGKEEDDPGPEPTYSLELGTNVMRFGRRGLDGRTWVVRRGGTGTDDVVYTHNLPDTVTFQSNNAYIQILSSGLDLIPVGTYTIWASYHGIQRELMVIIEDWYWDCQTDEGGSLVMNKPYGTQNITLVTGSGISASSILSGVYKNTMYTFESLPYETNTSAQQFSITRSSNTNIRFTVSRNTVTTSWGSSIIFSTNPEIVDPRTEYSYFGSCVLYYSVRPY